MRIVQSDSPLKYNHGARIYRLALVDPNASLPTNKDTYFAPTVATSGRKKIDVPGADDGVVAFLDWHHESPGWVYIDYMKTRRDYARRGLASQLVEALYVMHHDKDGVNWGKIVSDNALKMYETRRATEGPTTKPRSIGKTF